MIFYVYVNNKLVLMFISMFLRRWNLIWQITDLIISQCAGVSVVIVLQHRKDYVISNKSETKQKDVLSSLCLLFIFSYHSATILLQLNWKSENWNLKQNNSFSNLLCTVQWLGWLGKCEWCNYSYFFVVKGNYLNQNLNCEWCAPFEMKVEISALNCV